MWAISRHQYTRTWNAPRPQKHIHTCTRSHLHKSPHSHTQTHTISEKRGALLRRSQILIIKLKEATKNSYYNKL